MTLSHTWKDTVIYSFPRNKEEPPVVASAVDQVAHDAISSVPWLKTSIVPTGRHWGRRIADVVMSNVPKNLLGMAMLTTPEEENSQQVRLIFNRWDRTAYLGWKDAFQVLLTFPDGSQFDVEVPSSSRLIDGYSLLVTLPEDIVLQERPRQTGRVIPRVLFNVSQPLEYKESHEVRMLLRNIRLITDIVQCSSLYVVVEDDACRLEVESATDIPNFLEAYNTLIPGSYKADLVRYYLLYKYGGIYVDDKSTIRHSLDSKAFDSILGGKSGEGLSCDMFIGILDWQGIPTPEIAFMGARPGCNVILKALEHAIDNIMHRRYNSNRLDITGNTMISRVIEEGRHDNSGSRRPLIDMVPESKVSVGIKWIRTHGANVALLCIDKTTERIFHGDELVWHRQSIPFNSWPKPKTYYWHLWDSRAVYRDGNPTVSAFEQFKLSLKQNELLPASIGILVGIGVLCFIGYILKLNPTWSL